MTEVLTGPTESPPSASSPSPWWRSPERVIAVGGTLACLWQGKLSQEWAALVLATALGADVTRLAMSVARKALRLR